MVIPTVKTSSFDNQFKYWQKGYETATKRQNNTIYSQIRANSLYWTILRKLTSLSQIKRIKLSHIKTPVTKTNSSQRRKDETYVTQTTAQAKLAWHSIQLELELQLAIITRPQPSTHTRAIRNTRPSLASTDNRMIPSYQAAGFQAGMTLDWPWLKGR